MKKLKLTLLILFLCAQTEGQNTCYTQHQRVWNSLGSFSDFTSSYSFPLLDSQRFSIGALYENLYFTGIQNIDVAAAWKTGILTLSGGFAMISAAEYNLMRMQLGATMPLGESVDIGISTQYYGLQIPEYEQQSSIDFSIATRMRFRKDMLIEFISMDLLHLIRADENWDSYLTLRLLYDVTPKATLSFSAEKNKTNDMTGRVLIDYRPLPRWNLTAGYQFRPNSFLLGLQFQLSGVRLGIFSSTHSQLGNHLSTRLSYAH